MNRTTTPMSAYLRQMIKENYLLTREAQAAARLPDELQEQAVVLSEAQRVQAMENIVSAFLNPQPTASPTSASPPPAAHRKPTFLENFVGALFMVLMISVLFSGVRNVGGALWNGAGETLTAGGDLILWGMRRLHLADAPVWSPLPAPIITEAWYVPDHKVLLRWKSVGQGCTYRIYRTYGKRRDVPLNEMGLYNSDRLWEATSAIVGAGFDGEKDTLFGVVAVSPKGSSVSPLSNQIRVELDPRYRKDSLEPAPPSTTPQRQHAWNGA